MLNQNEICRKIVNVDIPVDAWRDEYITKYLDNMYFNSWAKPFMVSKLVEYALFLENKALLAGYSDIQMIIKYNDFRLIGSRPETDKEFNTRVKRLKAREKWRERYL